MLFSLSADAARRSGPDQESDFPLILRGGSTLLRFSSIISSDLSSSVREYIFSCGHSAKALRADPLASIAKQSSERLSPHFARIQRKRETSALPGSRFKVRPYSFKNGKMRITMQL